MQLPVEDIHPVVGWRKTDFILIRHGESNNNIIPHLVRSKFGENIPLETFEEEVNKLHDPDCPLSPRGLEQVARLQDHIAAGGFSSMVRNPDDWHIYSSPMRRCLMTCKGVSDAYSGKRVTVAPFLHESDGCYSCLPNGDTQGLPGATAAQVKAEFPQYRCLPGMESGWYRLPKKESQREFLARIDGVAQWMWQLHDQPSSERGFEAGAILVVHGNVIRGLIGALVRAPVLFTQYNTSCTHIQLWTDSDGHHRIPVIKFVNRVHHLLPAAGGGGGCGADGETLVTGNEVFEDHWIQEFIPRDD